MRVYSLTDFDLSAIKEQGFVGQTYAQIPDLDWAYNQIIETIPQKEDSTKLAAIQEERRNGNLIRVHLIFVFCMLKDSAGPIEEECSYLPVTIDLEQRCMIVKVWNQHGIIQESRPQIQLDKIYSIVEETLELELDNNREVDPQNVLYDMSKELFNQFF